MCAVRSAEGMRTRKCVVALIVDLPELGSCRVRCSISIKESAHRLCAGGMPIEDDHLRTISLSSGNSSIRHRL